MIASAQTTSGGPSLSLIEAGLVLTTVVVAMGYPQIASSLFSRVGTLFDQVARRRVLSVCVVLGLRRVAAKTLACSCGVITLGFRPGMDIMTELPNVVRCAIYTRK